MIVRIFQNTRLDVRYNSIFVRYFYHCHNASFRTIRDKVFSQKEVLGYFSNDRNVVKRKCVSVHQEMYNNIPKIPLLYKATPVLTSTTSMNHCSTVNGVRQYSSSAPVIVNETITYNSGLWKVISESLPVECITEALKIMHSQTGLPWWATIVLTTIIMRMFITAPLAIHDHQIKARLEQVRQELKESAKRIKMEIKMNARNSGWSQSRVQAVFVRALRQERVQLYQMYNCHPVKSIVIVMLQAPIWISFSFALRNICYMLPDRDKAAYERYLEFTTGGFGWMKDLTAVDHSLLFPILFGISGLAIIEVNQLVYNVNETKFAKYYRNFIKILTVVFAGIMAYLPSCLTLFWTTHNCCTVLQTLLLLSPKIRRLSRIPKTESEYQHPYLELYKRMKNKVGLK